MVELNTNLDKLYSFFIAFQHILEYVLSHSAFLERAEKTAAVVSFVLSFLKTVKGFPGSEVCCDMSYYCALNA